MLIRLHFLHTRKTIYFSINCSVQKTTEEQDTFLPDNDKTSFYEVINFTHLSPKEFFQKSAASSFVILKSAPIKILKLS